MKKVIIMRGSSGVGKSTYVKRNFEGAPVCSADNFFINAEGEYDFDAAKLGEAHNACFLAFVTLLRAMTPVVVVDNTHCRRWEVNHYIQTALLGGYEVEVHQFTLTTIDQVRMIAERAKAPPIAVYRQAFEFEPRIVEERGVKVVELG